MMSSDCSAKPISRRTKGMIRSSQQVRSKFFQRIGIATSSHARAASERRDHPSLRYAPSFYAPLRYDQDEERRREERRRSRGTMSPTSVVTASSSSSTSSTEERRVMFQESVAVVPIPMRDAYSQRIRSKLWSDAVEMCENIDRNLVEFTAENGNWRTACLEDQMYICGFTGELIHPVHVEKTKQYVI